MLSPSASIHGTSQGSLASLAAPFDPAAAPSMPMSGPFASRATRPRDFSLPRAKRVRCHPPPPALMGQVLPPCGPSSPSHAPAPPRLLGLFGELPQAPHWWVIQRRDIIRAIRRSKRKSAPGPDGLPYGVWRALGPLAVDLLTSVAGAMQQADSTVLIDEAYWDDSLSFNGSTLVCLPKKPSGVTESDRTYYDASATRPLS